MIEITIGDVERYIDFVDSGGWYLHGNLEKKLGTDNALISYAPEIFKRETLKWSSLVGTFTEVDSFVRIKRLFLRGIIKVRVLEVQEDCLGFFWIPKDHGERVCVARNKNTGQCRRFDYWIQRGLIVLSSDTKAVNYAKECMIRGKDFI